MARAGIVPCATDVSTPTLQSPRTSTESHRYRCGIPTQGTVIGLERTRTVCPCADSVSLLRGVAVASDPLNPLFVQLCPCSDPLAAAAVCSCVLGGLSSGSRQAGMLEQCQVPGPARGWSAPQQAVSTPSRPPVYLLGTRCALGTKDCA